MPLSTFRPGSQMSHPWAPPEPGDFSQTGPEYHQSCGRSICPSCQCMLYCLRKRKALTRTEDAPRPLMCCYHHLTPATMLESSLSRCYICSWVVNQMSSEQKETFIRQNGHTTASMEGKLYILRDYPSDEVEDQVHIEIDFWSGSFEEPQYCFGAEFLILSDVQENVIALDVPLGYSYRFGNNSRYTYDRIQHWLSQCSPARHPECHSHLKDKLPGLPTRFLRIDNLKVVQLVETCTLTEHPDYVTLSHCWGGVEPFTLTRATRDTLHSGLKTNKLPKSFRDAVEITLKLGKRYIWIDSLCIYQDDLSDWKEEARRMADVYSGSYCNIASTSAANPMGGCFGNRDRRFLAPVSLKFDDNLPESAWLVCPRGLWANQMAHLPLLGRGWVWQERLLAPRTVHFSHQQIYWECSHLLACEAFPRGYALTSKEVGSLVSFEIHPKHGGPNTMDNWNNIISSYSRSHLTNARDKLVAISGVATRMGSDGVRGSYYAGLWEKTFFWNFCWSVNHVDYDAKTFVEDDLAPSWSWASVTPPVSFLATEKVGVLFPFLTLIEVVRGQERKQITLDGLSRMCAWMVRVEGPLYAVSFLAMNCTSSISGHEFSRYWQEGGDMFYTSVAEIATIPASGGRTVQSINARVHWDRGHDNCTKSDANQCYLLNREFYVLGSFPSAYPEPLGIFDSHLLLERLQGGEAGKFQRVGHIRVWYELLQGGLFIDGAESLPAGSFESRRIVRDEHGNTKHLYTISVF